jgi:signal transduction histidine kinase
VSDRASSNLRFPDRLGAPGCAAKVAARQAWGSVSLVNPIGNGAGAPGAGASRDPPDQARLRQLADEQAALRRVATLVAHGAAPEEVFAAVTGEIGRLLPVDLTTMCRYEPGRILSFVANWGRAAERFPVGSRWSLGGCNLGTLVFGTGCPARIDNYADSASGPLGAAVAEAGIRSSVATPILVEGRLWGVIAVSSVLERLPPDTEERLASFTELVATAIANAESTAALARLADEQAALRRVATLVAHGAAPEQVSAAVIEEAGRLCPVDMAAMGRYEPSGSLTFVASWGRAAERFPVGSRWSLGGHNIPTLVFGTGRPARLDNYADSASGQLGTAVAQAGIRSSVGTPIIVEGRLWGVIAASSTLERLPPDTEERLASFTELVATAIANAESHAALTRLAEEQVALRRVATLVAQGVPPVEIFSAVSDEVARLFRAQAGVLRFEHGDPAVVFVGVAKTLDIPVGTRWEFEPGMALAEVYRTGCSARVDAMDWPSVSGPVAGAARRLGIVSTVASPIVGEGRLWGAVTVASTDALLPHDLEGRLEKFTELVATAIANAESRSELAASRRRIVAASDEARRRIERDLHDGTQQRLVALGLAARTAEADARDAGSGLQAGLSRIAAGLADAVTELQELSRGIHPAILSERGLGPALRTLARRSAVPVDLDVTTSARFPEPIEVAAYYVASEALANAMKHAQATCIEISLAAHDTRLLLSIRDDGVGGANAARGSGLVGLTDRVEALGGSIRLHSAARAGTQITVDLPLGYESARGAG